MSNVAIPEFGTKRENEERRDGGLAVVFDPATKTFAVGKQEADGFLRLFSGGVDPGEDMREGILREVVEESGLSHFKNVEQIGEAFAHYHNSLRNVNRVTKATCLLVVLQDTNTVDTKLEAHEKFSLAWATEAELRTSWTATNVDGGNDHWLYFLEKATARLHTLGYL